MQRWSRLTGKPVGLRFEPRTLWELARRWYDDRLDYAWRRRTPRERQAILEDVGLTAEDWRIG